MQVPSYIMLGIPNPEEAPPTPQRALSPLGEACSRTDLTAIHQLFVISDYREDDGNHEVLFFFSFFILNSNSIYYLQYLTLDMLCLSTLPSCRFKSGRSKCEKCWRPENVGTLLSGTRTLNPP